jgi:serine/threonine-protein kinase
MTHGPRIRRIADAADSGVALTQPILPSQELQAQPATLVRGDAETEVLQAGGSDDPGQALPSRRILEDGGFDARYELRAVIGAGGMGQVRLCHDRRIGRDVAMKVMHRALGSRSDLRARFVQEACVQGQLEHPSVVPVYDVGISSDGEPFFTMKRIKGLTLERILEGLADKEPEMVARYSRRKLLSAFSSACAAVAFAHARGIVHRDLKPANVMLGDFGEINVLDWGLAKIAGQSELVRAGDGTGPVIEPAQQTAHGAVLGTLGYMAPEQARGETSAVDQRADVYALGAMLFEILTERPLHPRSSTEIALSSTLQGADARPSVRVPDREIAPELEVICVRATALDPTDRFESARELHEAIERTLDGDRDTALRREMAEKHAQGALAAADKALALTAHEQALAARREALREVGRALALDPENSGAMRAMVRLLGEPPRNLPPEVEQDIAASKAHQQRWMPRAAAVVYASCFAYLPLFVWSGIRDVGLVALFFACMAICAAISVATSRGTGQNDMLPLACVVMSNLGFATAMSFFGPLILLPAIVAANTTSFAIYFSGRLRIAAVAAGCVAILVPLLLEITGIVPPAYAFTNGTMIVLPRALELSRSATLAFLGITAIACVISGAITAGSLCDSLADAQRRLYLHAWHMRSLVSQSSRREAAA